MRRILLFSAMLTAASTVITFAQTPGNLKWRLTVDGDVSYSSPSLAPDGTLYVGRANLAGGGSLWAINTAAVPLGNSTADAYARWKIVFSGNGTLDTPAIGNNGTIYLGTDINGFSALNPTNGEVRWNYSDPQSQSYGIQSSAAIGSNSTVYVGIWQNVLALTNSPGVTNSTPARTFQYPSGDPSVAPSFGFGGFEYGSPVVGSDGTVYVNSDYGQLFAITNGLMKWVSPLLDFSLYFGSGVSGSPAIGPDGTIYFGTGNYFLAVDPATGAYRWTFQTDQSDDAFQTGPVIGPDGTIYVEVFGVTNRFFAFDPASSTPKWTNTLAKLENQTVDPIAKQGSCAVASNAVYVTDTDGMIYSFDPQTGHTNWTYATGTSGLNAPVIGPDGTIYVSSYEAGQPYVYAIYGNPPATNSNWPQFRKDAQRTALQTETQSPSGPITISAPLMTTNGFQFTITGPDGQTVSVEASDDLVTWASIATGQLTGGTWTFVDSASGNHPHRYYRVVPGTSSNVSVVLAAPLRTGGGFQFLITGPSGKTASVDASLNLSNWTNVGSVFLTNGSAVFLDSSSTNFTRRFYRASAQ